MKKSKKGFTLIELVISMAIIAVLLLLATGRYRHHVERAKDIHIIADTSSLQQELKTELLHDNKEFKGNPVDKNTLVGKKIYSARKLEDEIPAEQLYEVENPKEYLNTVLTGKFIASANADTYYVDNGGKPNTGLFPDHYGDKKDVIEQYKGFLRVTGTSGTFEKPDGASFSNTEATFSKYSKYDVFYTEIDSKGVKYNVPAIIHKDTDRHPIVRLNLAGTDVELTDSKGKTVKYKLASDTTIFNHGNQKLENGMVVQASPTYIEGKELDIISVLDSSTPLQGELKTDEKPVCEENVINKLNGNYVVYFTRELSKIALLDSDGNETIVDIRCLNVQPKICSYDLINLNGKDGTGQLYLYNVRIDPIFEVIERRGSVITVKDKENNIANIDIGTAEVFFKRQRLEGRKVQLKMMPNTNVAEIVRIVPEKFPLYKTLYDLEIPTISKPKPPVEIEETITLKNQVGMTKLVIDKAGEIKVYHLDKPIAAVLERKLQENEKLEVKITAKPTFSEQDFEVTRIDVKVDGEYVDIEKLM